MDADDEPLPEGAWWLAIGVLYVPVTVGCVAWMVWQGDAIVRSTAPLGAGMLLGAVLAGVTIGLGGLPLLRDMEQALQGLVGPMRTPTVLALAVSSAVAEELLFRGLLQSWWGFWPTAVAFALVHVPHTKALWPWPFFAFGMGVVFGGLTVYTGDLGAAIGAHFALNAVNLHRLSRDA